MTGKRLLIAVLLLTVLVVTVTLSATAVYAKDTVLIQSGKTQWRYLVTDTDGFGDVDRDWYLADYDRSSWKTGVSPFGENDGFSGWKGKDHGIFLVTTFTLDAIPEDHSLDLFLYYDNTAKVYLNGSMIYSDKGWNDYKEHFLFSTEHLKVGENTLAISILDDVGGRGFDLTATLVPKAPEEVEPPEEKPTEPDELHLITKSWTEWEYKVTTTDGFHQMDKDWMLADYDRSAWKLGAGPFGTNINSKNADRTGWKGDNHGIFLVTTFEIDNLEEAKKHSFFLDVYYDNTMTVYLNGKRILYRETWNTSYEKIGINFPNYLVEGENTLAVSLLDDVGGREFDMSLILSDEIYTDPLTVTDEQLAEAGLPVLRINTDSGDYVRSRLEYVTATMVFDNMSAYPEEDNIYTEEGGAPIEIRGRGNSTWNNGYKDGKPNTLGGDTHTRKVPYNIKLDEKVDLFGMGKSKKWVLLANYMDRSNLRNKLIFDLSGRMGMTYPQSVYVNLVLNGEYMGVYALTEKVDVDLFEGAVTDFEDYAEDFAKAVAKKYGYDKEWRSAFEDELCSNLSWLTEDTYKDYTVSDFVDLSGVSTKTGYLIEYDGYADEDSFFHTGMGVPLKVSNLEGIKSNPAVYQELKQYFADFEEALSSDTFYNSKGLHYSDYVNMDSFVDFFLLNTLILNVEFGYKSMYMTIGSDGKLTFGPCWDFDWSSGNPFLGANGQYDHWYNDGRAGNNKWYRKVYGDPWFMALVRERWATLGDAVEDMIDSMDSWEAYLLPSTVLEYAKFSADSYETDFKGRTGGRTFSQEVNQLRTFLKNRKAWLDKQFDKRDPDVEGFGMEVSSSLKLTLGGAGITAKHPLFDYATAETKGTVSLSIERASAAYATVYLNGKQYTTVYISSDLISSGTLKLEDMDVGVNVITVYAYTANRSLLGSNYLSLTLPGEKQIAPTLGSYLPGSEPEPDPTPDPEPDPVPDPDPEPDPKPDDGNQKTLSTDTVELFAQTKAASSGKYDLRLVFVADQAYLFTHEFLTVTVTFTTSDGFTRFYRGRLSLEDSSYSLCRNVTAEGDLYTAAAGDLIFGNIFTHIPDGKVTKVSVLVKNQDGTTLLDGSYIP